MAVSVIVAPPDDAFAEVVRRGLKGRGHGTRLLEPQDLGDLRITIDSAHTAGDGAAPGLDEEKIGVVVWRARPDGSLTRGWSVTDSSFADAEVRSTWLAVLDHPAVFAINQYEADLWFEGAGWAACRRRLAEADIPLAPFGYGVAATGLWLPFRGRRPRPPPPAAALRPLCAPGIGPGKSQQVLALFGDIVNGRGMSAHPSKSHIGRGEQSSPTTAQTARPHEHAARAAAAALDAFGIHLAMLFMDMLGRVRWVDPLPLLLPQQLEPVGREVVRRIHAHLSSR